MKAKFIKKQNGFVVSDAMLAMLILMMFTGIITSLIYNIVLTSKRIKINSQEIAYITEVFNYAEQISYSNVTADILISHVNAKSDTNKFVTAGKTTAGLETPYKMTIEVEKYNETAGNTDKKDLLKTIKIKVECTLSKKTYSTEMSTLRKVKENEIQSIL